MIHLGLVGRIIWLMGEEERYIILGCYLKGLCIFNFGGHRNTLLLHCISIYRQLLLPSALILLGPLCFLTLN